MTQYKAFISYKHESELNLAGALKQGLQKFARPWNRLRALKVYRDTANQNLTPDLLASVKQAMSDSEYFVLMASPGSAQSKWVPREIQHWLDHAEDARQRLLIVLCGGSWQWCADKGDFDWSKTDCLPQNLSGVFTGEPLFLDLREVRKSPKLTLDNPDFRDKVARLSATLRGISLEDMLGVEATQFRRTRRLKTGVIFTLLILTSAVIFAGYRAYQESQRAKTSLAQTQWSNGILQRNSLGDTTHAAHWFARAAKSPDGMLADSAFLAAWQSTLGIQFDHAIEMNESGSNADFTGNKRFFTSWGREGLVRLRDRESGKIVSRMPHDTKVNRAMYHAATGRVLSVDRKKVLRIWAVCEEATGSEPVCSENPDVAWYVKSVTGAVFNELGTEVLGWDFANGVKRWDAIFGHPLPDFACGGSGSACPEAKVTGARFNLQGNQAVSWHSDNSIRTWVAAGAADTGQGACESGAGEMRHRGSVKGARLNKKSQRILSWGRDNTARLWSLPCGKEEAVFRHGSALRGAVFSPDEKSVLSWSEDGSLRLWVIAGKPEWLEARHNGIVEGAEFSGDGSLILSWGSDGTVRLWNSVTLKEITPAMHHRSAIKAATIEALGSGHHRVIAQGSDGSLRWWDIQPDRRALKTGDDEKSVVWDDRALGARFNPLPGARAVGAALSWGRDKKISIWDMAVGRRKVVPDCSVSLPPVLCHGGAVNGAMLIGRDNLVLSWSADDTLRLWSGLDGKEITSKDCGDGAVVLRHQGTVLEAVYGESKRRILSRSKDGTARLWSPRNCKELNRFKHTPGKEIRGALFNPDESRVLSWSEDGSIRLWDVGVQGKPLRDFSYPGVLGAAFGVDDSRIIAWGGDDGIKLWLDSETAAGPSTLLPEKKVLDVSFSASKRQMVSWDEQKELHLWDAGFAKRKLSPNCGAIPVLCHDGKVQGALFSPDESMVLSWSKDDSLRLWKVKSGRLKVKIMRHEGDVVGARFNSSGNRILSWGEDGTVRLWDVSSGDEVITALFHGGKLGDAVFNHDESRILSWNRSGELRFWDISYPEDVDAEQLVNEVSRRTGTKMTLTGELEVADTTRPDSSR